MILQASNYLLTMEKINCIIVDDEPIARNGILEHIQEIDFMHATAVCRDAMEANSILQSTKVEVLFMDIEMPKINGLDFLKNLKNPPLTILTTAYPQYAIESYELNVLDYLLKPISFPRFLKTAMKVKAVFEQKHEHNGNSSNNNRFFFVKCSQKIEKIMFSDVLYVEGLSNYIVIHTHDKKYISYLTFKAIEDQLPVDQFIRIHRSYLVHIPLIKTIESNDVIVGNHILPISKNYKDEVMNRIQQYLVKR